MVSCAALRENYAITDKLQIKLRGVRFLTTVGVMRAYCNTMARFFARIEGVMQEEAANGGDQKEAEGTQRLSSAALKRIFVESLPEGKYFAPRNDSDDSTGATSAAAPSVGCTRVVPPIRVIDFVQDEKDGSWYWLLDFTVRKDEPTLTSAPKDELQPEFAGAVFVFLRKLSQATDPSTVRLSSRWDEMPYDQQRSLSDIVCAFDIPILLSRGLGTPTAEPASCQRDAVDAIYVGDDSLLARAEEYVRKEKVVGDAPAAAQPLGRQCDDDDDGLVLLPSGCHKCGLSGHPATDCPHDKKS